LCEPQPFTGNIIDVLQFSTDMHVTNKNHCLQSIMADNCLQCH
jgi:hypothetical protein